VWYGKGGLVNSTIERKENMTTKEKVADLQKEIQKVRLIPSQVKKIKSYTGNNCSDRAKKIRESFKRYMLCDAGAGILCETDCSTLPNAVARLTEWLREFKEVKKDLLDRLQIENVLIEA